MTRSPWRNLLARNYKRSPAATTRRQLKLDSLERRDQPVVGILGTNASGQGYAALSVGNTAGFVPPDTCGAAGPSAYVETVNQNLALYPNKSTGASPDTDDFDHFWFTTGGLSQVDPTSFRSDPIVVYDEKIGRFIVGDQDVRTRRQR